MRELHVKAGPLTRVVFEEVRAHKGTAAAHTYGAFLGQLTAWCELHQVPYQGVPVATIKKHATGKGNAGKEEMIAAARARGYSPIDDNEADALAILHWALAGGASCLR
jgi:Holliday junction resolvasome RuvABC endonuclease subunit